MIPASKRSAVWASVCVVCTVGGFALGRSWRKPSAAAHSQPLSGQQDQATPVAGAGLPSLAPLIRSVRDGVVGIRARGLARPEIEDREPRPTRPTQVAADHRDAGGRMDGVRQGAGMLVSRDGRVLTALHLVDGANRIEVLVPGVGWLSGELSGTDRAADVALVQLHVERLSEQDRGRIRVLDLADERRVEQGDWVVGIGSPMGFVHTAMVGIVSFVGRQLTHDQYLLTTEHLQISAPSGPGTSGGPILSMSGEVVGMTTRVAAGGEGLTFAVPALSLRRAMAAMKEAVDGEVEHGWAGISIAELRNGMAQVTAVVRGGPAHSAGLRVRDVVVGVRGASVSGGIESLHDSISWSPPGSVVELRVQRPGHDGELVISLEIGVPLITKADAPQERHGG